MTREFVYLPSFDKEWELLGFEHEDFLKLENYLLENSQLSPVISGTGGLRKLRWAIPGKGKRGGSRIIYIDFVAFSKIYLITAYPKSQKDNLTIAEKNILKTLVRKLKNENI
ncbi:MAG: type II toxin-antitoxin system RelE/ParE family toxin [Leptospirales bacterium]